jgi:hypothetical protein
LSRERRRPNVAHQANVGDNATVKRLCVRLVAGVQAYPPSVPDETPTGGKRNGFPRERARSVISRPRAEGGLDV